uniref:Uncharacterized protein n=1 Tax=Arundo donax TaxID=35708 RepID=A0A0A9DE73_ARUDO
MMACTNAWRFWGQCPWRKCRGNSRSKRSCFGGLRWIRRWTRQYNCMASGDRAEQEQEQELEEQSAAAAAHLCPGRYSIASLADLEPSGSAGSGR